MKQIIGVVILLVLVVLTAVALIMIDNNRTSADRTSTRVVTHAANK